MPKKARVYEIVENLPDEIFLPKTEPIGYLIHYKFGKQSNSRFYSDLIKLERYIDFEKLERGVINATNIDDAYAVMQLIKHYGGDVRLFKADKIDPSEVMDYYG
jgi:hypothetical protein